VHIDKNHPHLASPSAVAHTLDDLRRARTRVAV
jgi:hypothetical protein